MGSSSDARYVGNDDVLSLSNPCAEVVCHG